MATAQTVPYNQTQTPAYTDVAKTRAANTRERNRATLVFSGSMMAFAICIDGATLLVAPLFFIPVLGLTLVPIMAFCINLFGFLSITFFFFMRGATMVSTRSFIRMMGVIATEVLMLGPLSVLSAFIPGHTLNVFFTLKDMKQEDAKYNEEMKKQNQ